MREEMIATKLDGMVRFEWWDKEDFHGRSTKVYGGEVAEAFILGESIKDATPEQVIPIPDDRIVCDFCNELITEFPVPVMGGSYALCPVCFERVKQGEDKMEAEVKHKLLVGLRAMSACVGQLSRLYDEHEELNDQVDISQIVPMSLDEWVLEIDAKIDEIENMA